MAETRPTGAGLPNDPTATTDLPGDPSSTQDHWSVSVVASAGKDSSHSADSPASKDIVGFVLNVGAEISKNFAFNKSWLLSPFFRASFVNAGAKASQQEIFGSDKAPAGQAPSPSAKTKLPGATSPVTPKDYNYSGSPVTANRYGGRATAGVKAAYKHSSGFESNAEANLHVEKGTYFDSLIPMNNFHGPLQQPDGYLQTGWGLGAGVSYYLQDFKVGLLGFYNGTSRKTDFRIPGLSDKFGTQTATLDGSEWGGMLSVAWLMTPAAQAKSSTRSQQTEPEQGATQAQNQPTPAGNPPATPPPAATGPAWQKDKDYFTSGSPTDRLIKIKTVLKAFKDAAEELKKKADAALKKLETDDKDAGKKAIAEAEQVLREMDNLRTYLDMLEGTIQQVGKKKDPANAGKVVDDPEALKIITPTIREELLKDVRAINESLKTRGEALAAKTKALAQKIFTPFELKYEKTLEMLKKEWKEKFTPELEKVAKGPSRFEARNDQEKQDYLVARINTEQFKAGLKKAMQDIEKGDNLADFEGKDDAAKKKSREAFIARIGEFYKEVEKEEEKLAPLTMSYNQFINWERAKRIEPQVIASTKDATTVRIPLPEGVKLPSDLNKLDIYQTKNTVADDGKRVAGDRKFIPIKNSNPPQLSKDKKTLILTGLEKLEASDDITVFNPETPGQNVLVVRRETKEAKAKINPDTPVELAPFKTISLSRTFIFWANLENMSRPDSAKQEGYYISESGTVVRVTVSLVADTDNPGKQKIVVEGIPFKPGEKGLVRLTMVNNGVLQRWVQPVIGEKTAASPPAGTRPAGKAPAIPKAGGEDNPKGKAAIPKAGDKDKPAIPKAPEKGKKPDKTEDDDTVVK